MFHWYVNPQACLDAMMIGLESLASYLSHAWAIAGQLSVSLSLSFSLSIIIAKLMTLLLHIYYNSYKNYYNIMHTNLIGLLS